MDLKLMGPPGGSGLWETVRVAIQGGWSTTFKLGFLQRHQMTISFQVSRT
jgi:hypothetical protein